MNSDNPAIIAYSTGKPGTKLLEQALQMVDIVTCSTHRLADEYKKFRSDMVVCENFITEGYLELLAPKVIDGAPKNEGKIRIGYAGSVSHTMDVALVRKPLEKILAAYPQVEVVFFGQPPPWQRPPKGAEGRIRWVTGIEPEIKELPTEFMGRYYQTVASLGADIAIAPLAMTVFGACRSFVKALEYGMLGLPVVASSYGPYRDYRSRGGPIVTVSGDDRSWVRALSELIESQEARADLAQRNLAFIREHHTTGSVIGSWERVIAGLAPPSALTAPRRTPSR